MLNNLKKIIKKNINNKLVKNQYPEKTIENNMTKIIKCLMKKNKKRIL